MSMDTIGIVDPTFDSEEFKKEECDKKCGTCSRFKKAIHRCLKKEGNI